MPRADEKLVQDFYYFWKWEYSRRNIEYKDKFEATLDYYNETKVDTEHNVDDMFSVGDYCLVFGIGNHRPGFVESKFYRSSNELMAEIISDNLTYQYPVHTNKPTGMTNVFLFEELHDELLTSEYVPREMKETLSRWPDRNIEIVTIDFTMSFEDNVNCLRDLYAAKECIKNNLNHHVVDTKLRVPLKKNGEISRLPKRNDRDLPRAIGLWLWDYVDSNRIKWTNRAKSYAAFQSKYQNYKHPECFVDGYNSTAQLADLLKKTRQCIEEIKVLPMV